MAIIAFSLPLTQRAAQPEDAADSLAQFPFESSARNISMFFPSPQHAESDAGRSSSKRTESAAREFWRRAMASNGRNLTLALYPPKGTELTAKIHVRRALRDHQTTGFFKIGALPFLVAQDTSIELHNPFEFAALLRELGASADEQSGKSKTLELRNLVFSVPSAPDWKLKAGRAVPESDGVLKLTDVLLYTEDGTRRFAKSGLLSTGKDHLGRLRLSSSAAEFRVPGFHQYRHKKLNP